MNKLKHPGKIIFDPLPLLGNDKQKQTMFKPWWVIVIVPGEIGNYYRWFLEKKYGLELMLPAWGNHISVIRGEIKAKHKWEEIKKQYNKKQIEFEYSPEILTNGKHWWFKVYNPVLNDIREQCGLTPQPHIPFHLTLGMPNVNNIDHSRYIYNNITYYNGIY